MVLIENLIVSLENLILELEDSGKVEIASSFREIIISLSEARNINSCKATLAKLINSGAISQYANFSYKQDELFDKVYEEAKNLNSLSK